MAATAVVEVRLYLFPHYSMKLHNKVTGWLLGDFVSGSGALLFSSVDV